MSSEEILNDIIAKERAVIENAQDRIRDLIAKRDERVIFLYNAVCEKAVAKGDVSWENTSELRKNQWREGLKAMDAYNEEQRKKFPLDFDHKSLNQELSELFNRRGVDAEMKTHDFVLAEMVELFLNTIKHRNRREYYLNGVPTEAPVGSPNPEKVDIGTGKPDGQGGYYEEDDDDRA